MILTRSTRLSQPTGPVEPIGTWAAVSVPGGWLDGDANPVESASGNVVFRNRTVGGLATAISSSGAYVSYGANARMQLSSSSGVIAFVAPSFATQSSLFSTNLANTVTTNAFYVAAKSTGCVIDKANTAGIIGTTNAPLAGRLNVLAWRYNNVTGDAALALNGVLTKATSAQTFTHGTVARGRFRLTDTVQSGTHNQLLFAITPRQIGDAELLALSRNPWQLFRPVQRRVYFDMGAGGGGTTHTVTADPVDQGSTTTRPGLTQTHITTASAVAQGATVSRPAITQTHVVTARAVAQGSTVNAPAVEVGSITVVTARPVVQSSTVNAPSIVQTHIVTARPALQGGTVTRPGLNQTHTVTARAVTQSSVVNAPSVDVGSTPATVVTARPVAQGSTVNAPGIRQTHVTSARAVVQGSTINAPGLVQTHVVTARAVVQAGSVNKPWVTTGSGTFTGLSPADLAAIRAAVRAELHAELTAVIQIQTKVDAAL